MLCRKTYAQRVFHVYKINSQKSLPNNAWPFSNKRADVSRYSWEMIRGCVVMSQKVKYKLNSKTMAGQRIKNKEKGKGLSANVVRFLVFCLEWNRREALNSLVQLNNYKKDKRILFSSPVFAEIVHWSADRDN